MYVTASQNLPLSLDVQISVSKAQQAVRTNYDILCVVCENLGLLPDATRLRFYTDINDVENDYGSNSDAYNAALAFFDQSPAPEELAIAEAFMANLPAQLVAGIQLQQSDISTLAAIVDGQMTIAYNNGASNVSLDIFPLDFSGVTTPQGVAAVIDAQLNADLTCAVKILPGGQQLIIIATSNAGSVMSISFPIPLAAVGDNNLATAWTNNVSSPFDTFAATGANITSAINSGGDAENAQSNSFTTVEGESYEATINLTPVSGQTPTVSGTDGFPTAALQSGINIIPFKATGTTCVITIADSAPASWSAQVSVINSVGTYVGDLLYLTAAKGSRALQGYAFNSIADELASIQNAANDVNEFIYGWCFGSVLRDAEIQAEAAAWALAQNAAMMMLLTNDLTALSPSFTEDIGAVVKATSNRRVVSIYHDNPQQYPDVSQLAFMLSVNYQLQDSTVTAKFKKLPGITPVTLPNGITDLQTLEAKGYNVYTAMTNQVEVYREGTTEDTTWYMDTVINFDNFVQDLTVNVYNVFLRNKKVPYTGAGQLLLIDAAKDTGNQYVYNGTVADRLVTDLSQKSGVAVVPAVQIIPTPINQMSAAQRATRTGPPFSMIMQEAGAIHSIAIAVEIVS